MSGVEIVAALLPLHAPLLEVVPIERIKADQLPQGVALPAIAFESISLNDRPVLKQGPIRRVTERVQVTVLARTGRERRAVTKLVRAALADRFGAIAGVTAVTVHTDGAGPDQHDEERTIFWRSQDFRVGFNEPA